MVDNGAAAVQEFLSWRPQFIWMDWHLPVMDGQAATQRIREGEGGRDVKIAAMTAAAFAEDRKRILASGVDDLVVKPFRPEEIYACIGRHLGVRYVSERAADPPKAETLTPDALGTLPRAIRDELADALLTLDLGRVRAAIQHASEVDSRVGAMLSAHAERLAFTPILRSLRAAAAAAATGKEAV